MKKLILLPLPESWIEWAYEDGFAKFRCVIVPKDVQPTWVHFDNRINMGKLKHYFRNEGSYRKWDAHIAFDNEVDAMFFKLKHLDNE